MSRMERGTGYCTVYNCAWNHKMCTVTSATSIQCRRGFYGKILRFLRDLRALFWDSVYGPPAHYLRHCVFIFVFLGQCVGTASPLFLGQFAGTAPALYFCDKEYCLVTAISLLLEQCVGTSNPLFLEQCLLFRDRHLSTFRTVCRNLKPSVFGTVFTC